MEAFLTYAFAGLGLLALLAGLVGEMIRTVRNKRCPVCGYLKRGPLHDEERCTAEHNARTASEDEIYKNKLFRYNEDRLGF